MSIHEIGAEPGDVISVRFAGVLRHYGVVMHRGTVIANSMARGGVREVSLAEFADGRTVRRHRGTNGLHPIAVEARARQLVGSDYRLASSNCIDLTRTTHRRSPTPWQVGSAVFEAVSDMVRGRRSR